MTIQKEYLAANADSLAATHWKQADGTAGTGFQDGATLIIDQGGQTIDQDTDQSAYDVEYFDVMPGFSGNLGSGTSPVKFGASYTAESATTIVSRFKYWASGGFCYWDCSHTSCDFLLADGGGVMNMIGGAVKHLHQDGATVRFNSTATVGASGTWRISGGYLYLEQHASNTFATVEITGSGTTPHMLKRGGNTLNIRGGNSVVDIKNGTVTNLNITGGKVAIYSHNATGSTLVATGGILDLSKISRPVTFTSAVLGRVQVVGYDSSLVTFATPQKVGRGPIGLSGVF